MLLRLCRPLAEQCDEPRGNRELIRRVVRRQLGERPHRLLLRLKGSDAEQGNERADRTRVHDEHRRTIVLACELPQRTSRALLSAALLTAQKSHQLLCNRGLVVGIIQRKPIESVRREHGAL